MKKLGMMLVLAGLLQAAGFAEDALPPPPELWFPVGEEIVYKVLWGIIPVGYASISSSWVVREGKYWLAIRIRAQSNSVVEKLYPVDDALETLIDPETFLPLYFEKKLSEGRYRAHQRTTFDHKNLTARWEALDEGDDREESFPIEADTRDLISLMYSVRREKMQPGEERHYRVMADEKIYDLFAKAEKQEKVKTEKYGKIDCVKIEPVGKFQGLFVRTGRMWMWVSQDDRFLTTKVVTRIPVANINMMLVEVRGPGADFWVEWQNAEPAQETERKPKKPKKFK